MDSRQAECDCGCVDKALGEYRFDEAANAVYQFFWATSATGISR